MFVCFLCDRRCINIKTLFIHFRIQHNSHNFTKYSCKQKQCRRDFQNLCSFRRHLFRQHQTSKTKEKVTFPITDQQSNEDNNQPESNQNQKLSENVSVENASSSSQETKVTCLEFESILKTSAAEFTSKLYSNPSLPRNHVQNIVDLTTEFLATGFISTLKDNIFKIVGDTNDERWQEVRQMFESLENPFKDLNTEHLRFQYFESKNFLIKPVTYTVGERLNSTGNTIENVCVTAQFVPIRSVLKSILEIPGVLSSCLEYQAQTENLEEPIISILQSPLWKNIKTNFLGKIVMPLTLYFDELEVNNPLGSSAGIHKLGAVYYSLGSMPQEHLSALNNIFLALLCHSSDRVEFGNRSVFNVLINELKFLETEGVHISTQDHDIQVYFALTVILGDNLGLHSILGLTESFSANFCCRFCKVHKQSLHNQTCEDELLLRTVENYEHDVALENSTLTGIKEKCIWNEIPSYHIVTNSACDLMHDILEGVCRYDMSCIINYLVNIAHMCNLDTINNRIQFFDYSFNEKSNIPPLITNDHLRQGSLVMSASEMLCLVRYFGLILGDLICESNEVWDFYLNLREIIDIVTCSSLQSKSSKLLCTLISEHNESYVNIFKKTLKPKYHFLLHYPKLMEKLGPLVNIWSMRFEAKHKELKNNAHVVTSRRNITLTLAIKHQLLLCHRLLSNHGIVTDYDLGPSTSLAKEEICHYVLVRDSLPDGLIPPLNTVSWIKCIGITYKPKMLLLCYIVNDMPVFGKIGQIVTSKNGQEVYFVINILNTIGFNSHVHAFHVELTGKWTMINRNSLFEPRTFHYNVMTDGFMYVGCRHFV